MERSIRLIVVLVGLFACWPGLSGGDGEPVALQVSGPERLLLEKYVADLPVNVQVAVAVVADDRIRCFGAVRSEDGLTLIDLRSVPSPRFLQPRCLPGTWFPVSSGSMTPFSPWSRSS